MVKEWCWFSQIDFFQKFFPHWVNVFFLPGKFYVVPHTQTRLIPFLGSEMSIPNLELFPNQEERLGLPCWTMIWAICVLVDVSKYQDTLTLEFSMTLVHLPFWPECTLITCPLLVLQPCCDIDYFCCRHLWRWWSLLCEYCTWAWIIFYNVTTQYNSAFVLLILRLQLRILAITSFFCFWLSSAAMPVSFSHSLSTAAFASGIFFL